MKVLRRLFLFIKIFIAGGEKLMPIIYATLIVAGKKTIADVPAAIVDAVKQTLVDLDLPELAE